jgi:hypothetical protein
MSQAKNGAGLIDYSEHKDIKGHKVITRIYRELLQDFVPEFKLKRQKAKQPAEESKES